MATALSHHLPTPFNVTPSPVQPSTSTNSISVNYCKDCEVHFESSKSLEVHLTYHRANLLTKWATQDPIKMENKFKPIKTEAGTPPIADPYYGENTDQDQSLLGLPPGDYPDPRLYHPANERHFSPGPYHHSAPFNEGSSGGMEMSRRFDGRREPPLGGREPPAKDRSTSTPEQILDLDSNKVHVYSLPAQPQFSYPVGSGNPFYRPYLMPQPQLPQFTQSEAHHPHHHHLTHHQPVFRAIPPSSQSPYDFQHGVSIGQFPPSLGCPEIASTFHPTVPTFRGSFPSVQSLQSSSDSGSPQLLVSPNPTSESRKSKGQKKTKCLSNDDEEVPTPKTKGWKGGECKRPKTYNCVACNKWFTSSGHLKRHYGTTLHKNSLRQRGEDPDNDHEPNAGKKVKERRCSPPGDGGTGGAASGGESSNNVTENPSRSQNPQHHHHHGGLLILKTEEPTMAATMSSNKSSNGRIIQSSDFGQLSVSSPFSTPTSSHTPTYLPIYHGGSQPPQPTHYSMMPPQFHPSQYEPSVYSVPSTSLYNGGYPPPPLMNGTDIPGSQLPPFSSVLNPYDQQFGQSMTMSMSPPCGSVFLHHPPNIGTRSPYDSESGIQSSSTNDGQGNGESPEAVRCVSTASGLEISEDPEDDQMCSSSSSQGFSSDTEPNHISKPSPSIPAIILDTTPAQVFKCPDCSKTFNRTCYLTQHANSSHSGGKPFKCPTCGKRFPEAPALSDHVAKHGTNKPYKCDLCPKQFNHKTDLRRHLCLHTGEKPFVCSVCGKGFIRKDHMTKHSETHRKVKGHSNIY